MNKAVLIYLDDGVLLTKKPYKDWREVQADYFAHYKASLMPLSKEELIEFFIDEYPDRHPFSTEALDAFFESDVQTIRTNISGEAD